jgi:hypothetical protein
MSQQALTKGHQQMNQRPCGLMKQCPGGWPKTVRQSVVLLAEATVFVHLSMYPEFVLLK